MSWGLGNGLTGVNMYDPLGQNDGSWVCQGTTQTYCSGGQQLYGWAAETGGTQLPQSWDTATGDLVYSYDDLGRLSATKIDGGQQAFSYTYDQYGNRLSQNVTAGSGGSSNVNVNPYNNIVFGNGYNNDAAANMTADGSHTYQYDTEGNLLSVDGGNTATYVYDAMNRRVRVQAPSGTNEFTYDYAGRRISTWIASANFTGEGRIYWGNRQIAFRSIDDQTYFDHQDWQGTERLRTNYAGAVAATYGSLPFGDGYWVNTGDQYANQDNAGFASLEYDSESDTNHAQFRQYSPVTGRWMSPDFYTGSYDINNPQSFNRYAYVLNNPMTFSDPSGLDGDSPIGIGGGIGACSGAAASGGSNIPADIGCGWSLFQDILGLFSGPTFHGSLQPRPRYAADPGSFGESPGIPSTLPQGNWGLALALGLPSEACEFGSCGAGLGGGIGAFTQGTAAPTTDIFDWCETSKFCQLLGEATGTLVNAIGASAVLLSMEGDNASTRGPWTCTASCKVLERILPNVKSDWHG